MSDETQRAATLIRKGLERELRLEAGRDPDGTGQVNPDALKLMVEELFEGNCGSFTIR